MITATVTAYSLALFTHVLAVVAAFGATFAYPLFGAAAGRTSPGSLPAIHRGIELTDRWLVTPGMLVVLASGLFLIADGGISMGESWISVGFLAIIVLFAMAHAFFAPNNRRAMELLDRDLADGGEPGEEYMQLMKKVQTGGQVATLIVVVTIFFMVVKP